MKKDRLHMGKIVLFVSILCLAAFLRLYKLDQIPPGVNRDEASIGYTAYSLIQTGKDEYGRQFPLSFQSFGDWKLPLYIYATIPFVKIFGMTELAVRLPSVIVGIAAVGLTYFFVEYFFASTFLSFLSMALLAVSPWHLHLSRVESESNVAVLFVTSGLLLFFKAMKGKKIFFIPSTILFALTYYTYHGNHIFTTLFLTGLLCLYWHNISKTKEWKLSILLFLFLVGFILAQTLTRADKTKISGISIFGDPNIIHEKIELPRNVHNRPQSTISKLAHNRFTYAIETILHNYLRAYSADFLFIKGGTNRAHNIANFGNMYAIEAPFLLLGVFVLLKSRKRKEIKLLLWWLLIAPVAASITKDAPHTNRMFAIFPVLPITVALGIREVFHFQRTQRFTKAVVVGIFLLYLGNFFLYIDRYYIHFPKEEREHWGAGYKAVVKMLTTEAFAHRHVIVANPEHSPYIFLLFYSNFDPIVYQKSSLHYPPTDDGFIHVRQFDRFEFREIDWGADLAKSNIILVDLKDHIPPALKIKATIIEQFAVISTP